MVRKSGTKNKVLHIWSVEEKEYLEEITPGHHYKDIQELVNKKFNLDLTVKQVASAIKRYNLKTGFTGQFEKGHTPVNKCVKGVWSKGSEKTWFKKGQAPINHRQVGSERVNVDGYIEIKVSEPNKWRLKHNIIWEKYNGSIPKGYAVIFGDSDKSNLDINNLILVSRKQLLTLNRYNLIQTNTELTKTAVIIANIHQKINQRKKKGGKCKK